ncbi:MAG: hypothetical protein KAH35_07895 [Candidatus Atribacteria bacterium]|nr:hypothetical protein [Candidatus Atribacteria bacterium]
MKDIRKWLLKNIDIKLLSLFLAVILWVYVASGENPIIENYIDVSLGVSNLKDNLVIKEIPENVSIGIKGPKDMLSNLSSDKITGIINLSEINEPGIYQIKVETNVPQKVEVIRAIPSEIKVEVEKISTKTMEIAYSLIGVPEKGYSLAGAPEFKNSKIKATGAQSKLDLIKQVVCPIDISGISEDTVLKIKVKPVDVNDDEIVGLQTEPEIMEVSIFITRGYPEKTLIIKPRTIGKPAPGYYISQILVNPDEISIYGNYSKINDLEFLETIPIDVNGITKTLSVKVSPALTEGLYIVESEPQLTEVSIQVKEDIIQKTLEDIPIKIENTSPFIFCNTEPQNADITIEGKSILIDKIEKEDVKIFVEFTENLKINQEIKLEVQLPEGVSLIKVEPEEVNLKINNK